MTTITLPPLPEPCSTAAIANWQGASEYRSLSSDYETHTARFSIDQLRADRLAVAQAVREAMIREADATVETLRALHHATMGYEDACVVRGAELCADAIRAIQIEVNDADR